MKCFRYEAGAQPFTDEEDMKPIDHSTATARVTIDGLAICHFYKDTRLWRIRFLRHNAHVLNLSIDGQDVPVANATSIRILTVDPETPFPTEYPEGCFYIRNAFRYSENMCWAINLSDPADVGEQLQYKPPTAFPVTTVDISDALFYVTRLFPSDLYWVPVGTNPNLESDKGEKYRYGRTSDELAADVFCRPGGKVVIEIDGIVLPPLDYDSRVHTIDFRNMDKKHATGERLEKGDFEIYYDAVQNARQRFAFWGEPKTAGLLSEVSDRTDCNTVWMEP
jgi:hypothetical protein